MNQEDKQKYGKFHSLIELLKLSMETDSFEYLDIDKIEKVLKELPIFLRNIKK